MRKAALIGCGNIGRELALHLDQEKRADIVALVDPIEKNATDLKEELANSKPRILQIKQALSIADLIIEAAHPSVVPAILDSEELDKPGKDLLVMSTGGLIDHLEKLDSLKHCKVKVPSGAIAGLDGIRAVRDSITSLTLTTTKSSKSLEGAPFIDDRSIALEKITEKMTIFEGALSEAIQGFPQNINVAASLFLASRFKDMRIKIIADPKTKTNTHHIECVSGAGVIETTTRNVPSQNPKTSKLAIESAKAALDELLE